METAVRVGQIYVDRDPRMSHRQLTVVSLHPQKEKKGRFKAGHTYAECKTSGGVVVRVDVIRLRSSAYRLSGDANTFIPFDVCEAKTDCGCEA